MSAVPDDAMDLPSSTGSALTGAGQPTADSRMQEIHERYAGPLLRFLLRLTLGDRQQAEDLLQETMLRAWRNIDVLPPASDRVGRWLFTVARNVAIDAARARRARPPEIAVQDISRLASPGDPVDGLVTAHTVHRAMERLTDDHRAVLIELYFRGLSTAETAVRLGVPEGTVKSRAYHAIRALREALGPAETTRLDSQTDGKPRRRARRQRDTGPDPER